MTTFIAIDGEADDRGRYVLMCDSTGRVLHNPEGITSTQAFEWLVQLAGGKRELVCFGLNYDANQWIVDLGERELARLAAEGRTIWRLRWDLHWTPAKSFEIHDHKSRRRVKVCEVFGFFQTSFVNALKTWGFNPPRELETMKRRRGRFTAAELQRVTDYCLSECRLLVELMGRLDEACQAADCVPAHNFWIGAGSIASRLLKTQGVKDHHQHDRDLADRQVVEDAILGAYFGGRVELLAQGVTPHVETRDIRSAYPHAATHLPSLAGAKIKHRKRYRPEIEHAIWRVTWEGQVQNRLAPFPVRLPGGSICYPASGEGCYHAIEVRTAIELGYQVKVTEGWELTTHPELDSPFHWIAGLFAHRAELKAKRHPAEKALKLGLNSVYGKLAQGYGNAETGPPFQSYMWAGEITARTRARMLALAVKSRGLLMISTDGLFATHPANEGTPHPELGSWEPAYIADLFCGQPGVYHGYDGEREIVKSRGFFAREVNYQDLRETWHRDGTEGVYHYPSRRFIGLRVALHRNRLDLWRTWPTEQRSLILEPQRKRPGQRTNGVLQLEPIPGPHTSVPYTPKQSLYDDPTDSDLENMVADDQPHFDGVS